MPNYLLKVSKSGSFTSMENSNPELRGPIAPPGGGRLKLERICGLGIKTGS
jgi:hypothetical protein